MFRRRSFQWLFLVLCFGLKTTYTKTLTSQALSTIFLDKILDKFGQNGKLTLEQFKDFGRHFGKTTETVLANGHWNHEPLESVLVTGSVRLENTAEVGSYVFCNGTDLNNCRLNQSCLTTTEIFDLFAVGNALNETSLGYALPSLIFSLQNEDCNQNDIEDTKKHAKPTTAQAWGYGIGFVSLICFISNIGAFLGPIMKSRMFKRVLMFCVALAAATLGATGLLVLIPESMHLTTEDSPVPDYNWKMTTALGGIYFFFLVERLLRIYLHIKERKKKCQLEVVTKSKEEQTQFLENGQSLLKSNGEKSEILEDGHGHSHLTTVEKDGKKTIAPVAWILLFGDALHNFVDGLSIGAAFTENVFTGMSVSLAILCEELPHELGDIAVLLHAGVSFKKALLYNFLAAVVCFLGLIIGTVVGEATDGNQWIFAIAGGLFVYIAFVDMVPEMNQQAADAEKKKTDSPVVVFVCQNAGLLVGFLIILLLVNFGGNIQV